MMQFVPYEKRSKKARRAIDRERRGTWEEVNPVTRIVNVKKQYSRPRVKRETRFLAAAS